MKLEIKTIFIILLSFLVIGQNSYASSDLTQKEKEFICKKALAKLNFNKSSDYNLHSKFNSILNFYSKRKYPYQCTISSKDKQNKTWNIELWSPPDETGPGWQSIRPYGTITKKDDCLLLSLYDIALKIQHNETYCDK